MEGCVQHDIKLLVSFFLSFLCSTLHYSKDTQRHFSKTAISSSYIIINNSLFDRISTQPRSAQSIITRSVHQEPPNRIDCVQNSPKRTNRIKGNKPIHPKFYFFIIMSRSPISYISSCSTSSKISEAICHI